MKEIATIFVYSTDMCEPCKNLKAWLRQEGIVFEEISVKGLTAQEREAITKNILAVSRIDRATVPAVRILIDGKEYWVSNHGESDISEMAAEIRNHLQ